MSNSDNPLITSNEAASQSSAPAEAPNSSGGSTQTLAEPQIANVQRIQTTEISGPLVVLFGPREIGKTVSLLRLCAYISRYEIRPNEAFRTDSETYQKVIEVFEQLRQDPQFAPESTGNIDFLLLNVTFDGRHYCQILEAPGEHFFNRLNSDEEYPAYMNRIFSADYRKIYVFFFELNMFNSDTHLNNYCRRIARLVKEKISSKRDSVIIVCNKADEHPNFVGGLPIKSEFQNALYNSTSFEPLKDALLRSGLRRVPFVVFSSGSFNPDGEGRKVFTYSPEHYPQELWQSIHESIAGKPWWKFW